MSTLNLLIAFGLLSYACASLTVETPCTNNFFYDALYDLEAMTVCPSPYVTERLPVTLPSDECKCCARGTLNISLSSEDVRRGVMVDLWMVNPSMWAFNLGDSQSNNGWKGDSVHSSYDAEIHPSSNAADAFTIWRNDQVNSPPDDTYHKVTTPLERRLTLIVKNGAVQWVNDVSLDKLVETSLFGLNGQYDAEAGGPADYNLFLGLNQVINGQTSRAGKGLCKVGIRFLCEKKKQSPPLFDKFETKQKIESPRLFRGRK